MKLPEDEGLGPLLSLLLVVLVVLLAILILSLPFSTSPTQQVTAIGGVVGLMTTIIVGKAAGRK